MFCLSWVRQQLHHLVLVGLVTIHDSIIYGFREVTQHSLFRAVVGYLVHHQLVFTDLVSNGVGVVDQVFPTARINFKLAGLSSIYL